MSKITWKTAKTISIGNYSIPLAEDLLNKPDETVGIRRNSRLKLAVKTIIWPIHKVFSNLLTDGFIEKTIGKWIKKYCHSETTFLEVGCGDMSLHRYLPRSITYNAFDISLSEFQVRRIRNKPNVNIALASATNMPVDNNTADIIVSTECLQYIADVEKAIEEIHRVSKPKAKIIISIPNNFCYKYQKKGPHPYHVQNWTYQDFIDLMESYGFKLLEGRQLGYWIPLPLWLTKTSYQLPIKSKNEYFNTNFFYVFETIK